MLFLIEANEKYIDELEQFKNEVLIYDKDNDNQFAGCMGLGNCKSAKEWIEICNLRKNAETCEQAGTNVPSTTYFAIRKDDDRLVGVIDLRHHINHPVLGTWGGHCGYSVRPSERGNGYAKEMLRLNIQNAREIGIEKLLVTCEETNTASEKTILANGGVFEKNVEADGSIMKRYWIDTKPKTMNNKWDELYEAAKQVLKPRDISKIIEAGGVAAAVESASGKIYVGVCVDTACTLGICAERNAIFNMITNGEDSIKRVIAIGRNGKAMPPCGACREFMTQLMPENYRDIEIMLDYENNKVVTLGELTPEWWL